MLLCGCFRILILTAHCVCNLPEQHIPTSSLSARPSADPISRATTFRCVHSILDTNNRCFVAVSDSAISRVTRCLLYSISSSPGAVEDAPPDMRECDIPSDQSGRIHQIDSQILKESIRQIDSPILKEIAPEATTTPMEKDGKR